eukprot:TRINITY_DN83320_c0_g1_i1.p1 TRINITY_DN83320_c0_g1~~TRINITY_DN83320_c0_g1_i1.p1  ORF type:complete len:179 (+),score=30.90 TRINITY_DN83320_c0_g1_i1:217-753(+)
MGDSWVPARLLVEAEKRGLKKQVSLPDIRKMTGHTMEVMEFDRLPGDDEPTKAIWTQMDPTNPAINTVKDLIGIKSKGGTGAPWATRETRSIAGKDIVEPGGTYRSYFAMMEHRRKHVRTNNGPNERFEFARGPPIASQDHGFGPQTTCRPPKYPISTSEVSRQYVEILKCTGGSKGR